ncbi:hypothetical protein BC828DRAFT_406039 [Blastocladiella britannica]|nr:hypothetical protein BC828DRAFT_406039 [Blastocladiella britannica]
MAPDPGSLGTGLGSPDLDPDLYAEFDALILAAASTIPVVAAPPGPDRDPVTALERENRLLRDDNQRLRTAMSAMQSQIDDLLRTNKVLATNLTSLFHTARLELARHGAPGWVGGDMDSSSPDAAVPAVVAAAAAASSSSRPPRASRRTHRSASSASSPLSLTSDDGTSASRRRSRPSSTSPSSSMSTATTAPVVAVPSTTATAP